MSRRTLIYVGVCLAACGPSAAELQGDATRDNDRALAASDARSMHGGTAFQPAASAVAEPSPPAPAGAPRPGGPGATLVAGANSHGLVAGEQLCGQRPPSFHDAQPVAAVDLGVDTIDRIEVREDSYDYVQVRVDCDHGRAAP